MTTTAQPTEKARESGGWVTRHAREILGLTQQELADIAGVTRDQVGRLERGDSAAVVEGGHCPFCGGSTGRGMSEVLLRVSWALGQASARRRDADSEAVA